VTALVVLVHAIDRLDWAGVRGAFADRLLLDYTSLNGGEPEDLAADELVERWRALLPGFEATNHLLGPVLATGDQDRLDAHVRAYHRIAGAEGGPLWRVAGHYVAGLDPAGRIDALTLETHFQDGNLDLPTLALARVEAGQGR
jgi:hypothetical protein